jgi:hypothetical protein
MYATILTIGLLVIGQVRVESERWAKWQEEVVVANTPSMWLGLTTELNAAGNWSAGVPGTGIDSLWGPADGDASSDMSIAGAATLVTRRDYRGDIGAPGSVVNHGLSTARYLIQHPGDFYWGDQAATALTQMFVRKPFLSDKLVELGGTLARLYVLEGRVNLTSVHSFGSVGGDTWLYIGGNHAHVTIAQMAVAQTLPDIIRMQAGQLTNNRDFSAASQALHVDGGEVLQTGLLKSTMMVRVTGGILRYEPATDPSAEAPFFLIDGGILDVRDSQFAIPKSALEIGTHGVLLGNAIDKQGSYYDLDMNEEYP